MLKTIRFYKIIFIFSLFFFLGINAYAQSLVPYRIKDKWGLSDADGNMKVKCSYDSIIPPRFEHYFGENNYFIYKNGLMGLVNSLVKEDLCTLKLIEPIYDSIITGDALKFAYRNNGLEVYDYHCTLIFPLKNNINRDDIDYVYIGYPKADWTYSRKVKSLMYKRKKKLIKKNELLHIKDNSYAMYGEYLYQYDNNYYRRVYLPSDSFHQNPTLVIVKLDEQVKKDLLEKAKRELSSALSLNKTDSIHIYQKKWFDSISIYPKYSKSFDVSYDTSARTDYSPGILTKPYNWAKKYKSVYQPSNNANLKFIGSLYPAYAILKDSGKVGLALADTDYKEGWACYTAFPPIFDSLIATQEGFRASTTHIPSFYFKKGDSIAVVCRGEIVAGPIKLAEKENIKYIDRKVYIVRSFLRDSSIIQLYNNNILFNPELPNFTFDEISLGNNGNDVIAIHNKDFLRIYYMTLNKSGKNIFEKGFEQPNAILISLKDGYYQNKYNGYLITKNNIGKYFWYTKKGFGSPWEKVYEVDKILITAGYFYKIEKQGKIGYVNGDGKEYFED